jgi:hypothetical protein
LTISGFLSIFLYLKVIFKNKLLKNWLYPAFIKDRGLVINYGVYSLLTLLQKKKNTP